VIDRSRPGLLGYCRRIAGDAGAQDAVQQACMSAWSALRRGHEVQHARAWLFTLAHRAALETLRSQGAPTDELPAALAGGPSPHELIEQSARARATLAAVAELPQRQRDALVWTSLHGRSGRDTAQALGVSEGALRQLIVRARARARASVGALVPPVLLWRLPHISGPRRLAGLAERLLGNAGTLSGGEALVWL